MPSLDPAAIAQKWQTRTAAASQDYADGVATTDKDPTQLAIAAGQRYIQNVTARFQDGTWAARLRAAGKGKWQGRVATVGKANFENGVRNAGDTVLAAFTPLLAYIDRVKAEVAAMPNVTDGDRDQRMLKNVQRMREYRKPS